MSHWTYKNKKVTEPPTNTFGFVYQITNLISNKKYVGRKYFYSTRRKPLTAKQKREGRKRRTKVTTESNWRTYMGSCVPLLNDIKELGKENFKFEILIYGETKGQVNFLEETVHHKFNVLIDSNYYNDSIGPRRFLGIKKDENLFKKVVEHLENRK